MPLSAFDPDSYDRLLQQKVARVTALLAPFQVPVPLVFPSPPSGYRMRAEFRLWHQGEDLNYVMFRPGSPKDPVPISAFAIAADPIQALMPALLGELHSDPVLKRKLFQVEFLTTLTADTLVSLIYHRPLDESWERRAQHLAAAFNIAIVGRSRKQKIVIGRDYVIETLPINGRNYCYRQYEQAFTQPNARVNIHMIEWAQAGAQLLRGEGKTDSRDNLLELYCGNGNFTLPLAQQFEQVVATEVAKSSIRAARENLQANDIDNVHMIRLSAEEVAQAMAGHREFRRLAELPQPLAEFRLQTLFVDPPRAGLDASTTAMASGFNNILYISCNPHSLVENLRSLIRTHQIQRFALFDQFPYTDHMECGVFLRRRSGS